MDLVGSVGAPAVKNNGQLEQRFRLAPGSAELQSACGESRTRRRRSHARSRGPWRRRGRGLSPTHFRKLWDEQVGVPPARYLTELPLRRACRLLVEEDEPIAALAAAVGFADALHFSCRFHAFTGIGPQAHRERHQPGRR